LHFSLLLLLLSYSWINWAGTLCNSVVMEFNIFLSYFHFHARALLLKALVITISNASKTFTRLLLYELLLLFHQKNISLVDILNISYIITSPSNSRKDICYCFAFFLNSSLWSSTFSINCSISAYNGSTLWKNIVFVSDFFPQCLSWTFSTDAL
jgi:hypothetical protein